MSKTETRIAVALEGIYIQLRRLNDGRDAFHREVLEVLGEAKQPDVCGESNYDSISPAFRRPQDVVTCERKPGHSPDFHEGSGRRWYIKDLEGSLRSEQPAAATDGQETLRTRLRALIDQGRSVGPIDTSDGYGRGWGDGLAQMANDLEAILDDAGFGPCPEES